MLRTGRFEPLSGHEEAITTKVERARGHEVPAVS